MTEEEKKIFDEQSRIKEAMLYAIVHTTQDWNGEVPYHPACAKEQIKQSDRFNRIYDNFVMERK